MDLSNYALSLCFLMFFMVCSEVKGDPKVFNLVDYGGTEGGTVDNSKALLQAWDDACKEDGGANLLIPDGVYLTNQVLFRGPCKGPIVLENRGVLQAPKGRTTIDKWIAFNYVDFLTIEGGGTFNGQGESAWGDNPGQNDPCIMMRLDFVNNAEVHNVRFVDSKNAHLFLFGGNNINIDSVNLTSSGQSPNTDGIKMGYVVNVTITNTNIGVGDDCIAILKGSRNINIDNINCGPGHGISIGSIGGSPDEEDISDVTVKNARIFDATNGLRIKTNPKNNPATVSHITYQDVSISNTTNPIIIDQHYGPKDQPGESYVQITDVKYLNIKGTSLTDSVVNFNCSAARPCQEIYTSDIDLQYTGSQKSDGYQYCNNVNGKADGIQNPPSCIGS